MKKLCRLLLSAMFLVIIPMLTARTAQQKHSASGPPPWVELGENGAIIARQVIYPVTGQAPQCPAIQISGVPNPPTKMQPRGAAPSGFSVLVCEVEVPPAATSATVNGIALPLPKANINNIVVIGDTGCRGSPKGKKVTPLEEPEEQDEE